MMDVIRSIMLYSWRDLDFVIFVRYLMGTAYLPPPLDCVTYNFFSSIVPKSGRMFFLDVLPEEAANRIAENREQAEMFETLTALRKIRGKALSLTRFDDWVIVNSSRSVNEVASVLIRKTLLE